VNPGLLRIDPWTLAAILGMAAASYACRAGGYWLFRQITPSPFLRAVLAYLPGALFASYVAPALLRGGPQAWAGGVATVAAMILTRNLSLGIGAGVAAAWAVYLVR